MAVGQEMLIHHRHTYSISLLMEALSGGGESFLSFGNKIDSFYETSPICKFNGET